VAGLILLALTSLVFPDRSILYQKANSTRRQGFDVFAFVKESLITQMSGIGLIIMASAAFADCMDHVGATATIVWFCIKPLRLIKAPYLILASGYVLGQCLHVAIPSATPITISRIVLPATLGFALRTSGSFG